MKKKPAKKMVGPTLQEFELVPVTDPAELATLDRRCRALGKGKTSAVKASKGKSNHRQ
jgi:hypothetical protein